MQVNKERLRIALEWLDKNNKAFHRNGIILDYKKLERYNGNPNLLSLLPKSKSIPLDQVPKDAVPSDTIPPVLLIPEESKEWLFFFYLKIIQNIFISFHSTSKPYKKLNFANF